MEALALEQTIAAKEPVIVVRLTAEQIDAGNASEVKHYLHNVVGGSKRVVLDMSSAEYIDSAGLNLLLHLWREVKDSGGDIKLCGLQSRVRMLIQLVRMHRIFEVFNTTDEAMRAFAYDEQQDWGQIN